MDYLTRDLVFTSSAIRLFSLSIVGVDEDVGSSLILILLLFLSSTYLCPE